MSRVTITDVRAAGFCLSGARRHCADLGLDFRALVREGLPVADLEQIDDALVRGCLDAARERESRDG